MAFFREANAHRVELLSDPLIADDVAAAAERHRADERRMGRDDYALRQSPYLPDDAALDK
ncbi:hypothetical protein [Mycolicibacterium rhodesiae]|uniref:hypothetical protein n=1 Tax=Mycolicibacterium rhodesiae TaxID=36814 RepID=UPI0002E9724D|nr:hypothetical protein [Mycolicibacterium rhodesiae]